MNKIKSMVSVLRAAVKYAPLIVVVVSAIRTIIDAFEEINAQNETNEN